MKLSIRLYTTIMELIIRNNIYHSAIFYLLCLLYSNKPISITLFKLVTCRNYSMYIVSNTCTVYM